MDKDDKADLQGEAFGATVNLLSSWAMTGKPPSVAEIATASFGIATMAIGMFNPVLGAVAGMVFSLIGGALFPDNEDPPMVKMYKQIMEEVGTMMSSAQMEEEVADHKAELGAVMDELQWMPAMLGGTSTIDEAKKGKFPEDAERTLLTYNIMIQHDIAKTSYKIQTSSFGKAESSRATDRWSAAMLPLAQELILLQTNLIFNIGVHVKNSGAVAQRALDLLTDWQMWIDNNLAKAEEGNRLLSWQVVKWDKKTPSTLAPQPMGLGTPGHLSNQWDGCL